MGSSAQAEDEDVRGAKAPYKQGLSSTGWLLLCTKFPQN